MKQTFSTTTSATSVPRGDGNTMFDRPSAITQPMAQPVHKTLAIGTMLKVGVVLVGSFALGFVSTMDLNNLRQTTPQARTQPEAQKPAADQLEDLLALSLSAETVSRNTSLDMLETPVPIKDVLRGLTPSVGPADTAVAVTPVVAAQDGVTEEERRAARALGLHMRMLREGVLAGVYTVENTQKNGAHQLTLKPINVELSRRFMKTLLVEAEKRGDIAFPKGLSTSSGDVDLDTMLFNLVQNSLANDGTLEGAEAAREMTRRAFAAASQGTTQTPREQLVAQGQTYTVEPGDSLAYISLKFYGRPGAYQKTFDANRTVLRTPYRIKVGQKLIIPG